MAPPWEFFPAHEPSTRSAFALIFAAEAGDNFPRFTICVALALALTAWLRSGMGYLRDPGRPKTRSARALRDFALNTAMDYVPTMALPPVFVAATPPRKIWAFEVASPTAVAIHMD